MAPMEVAAYVAVPEALAFLMAAMEALPIVMVQSMGRTTTMEMEAMAAVVPASMVMAAVAAVVGIRAVAQVLLIVAIIIVQAAVALIIVVLIHRTLPVFEAEMDKL